LVTNGREIVHFLLLIAKVTTGECPFCGLHITVAKLFDEAKTRTELQIKFENYLQVHHKGTATAHL
jgi:hypothetical protein